MSKQQYILNPAACDEISASVMKFCAEVKVDRKEMQRYRLSVEECLLSWLGQGCEGRAVTLTASRGLQGPFIRIEDKSDHAIL